MLMVAVALKRIICLFYFTFSLSFWGTHFPPQMRVSGTRTGSSSEAVEGEEEVFTLAFKAMGKDAYLEPSHCGLVEGTLHATRRER